jgi:Cu-Zn family superoxide dismutase
LKPAVKIKADGMKILPIIKTMTMKKSSITRLLITASVVSAITLVACNSNNGNTKDKDSTNMGTMNSSPQADNAQTAMATIAGTKADTVLNGTAMFEKDGDQVKMHLELTVPSKANQSVAVHFHAMSDCGEMGKMAGGHWNPTNEPHGKWGSGNFHSGDIGNISLDGTGKGMIDIKTNRWTLGGDSTTNIIGKTIIVHSGVDDYKSQPAGNSGERIGCGVIKQ